MALRDPPRLGQLVSSLLSLTVTYSCLYNSVDIMLACYIKDYLVIET